LNNRVKDKEVNGTEVKNYIIIIVVTIIIIIIIIIIIFAEFVIGHLSVETARNT
jgi:heme/copper-type cytochrome/quinol oxidase subunit 2